MSILDGYKVYITGLASVLYGVFLIYTGHADQGSLAILGGLTAIFGRHTLHKIEQKVG